MTPQLAADARLRDALPTTGSTTLLTYAMQQPGGSPLQAGATDVTLELVVSNDGFQIVTCAKIVVRLPVGPNAADLTADATGIQTQVPDGWAAAQDDGAFTLTPEAPPAGRVGRDGVAFFFTGLGVNDQPGTAVVMIDETASVPSEPTPTRRTAPIAVQKFPAQFALSDPTACPTEVPLGGTTTLMWTGTPSGQGLSASYTLSYDPTGTDPVNVTVDPTGPYTSVPLPRRRSSSSRSKPRSPCTGRTRRWSCSGRPRSKSRRRRR